MNYCTEIRNELATKTARKNVLDAMQPQWSTDQLWYEAIAVYWEKIDKVICGPNASAPSFSSLKQMFIGNSGEPKLMSTRASDLADASTALAKDLKPCFKFVVRAFNEADRAEKTLKSADNKANDVESAIEALAASDEGFRKSEIKKNLDAIFASLVEIQAKSKTTLAAALLPLKNAEMLTDAIQDDNGLLKHIDEIKNNILQSPNHGVTPPKDSKTRINNLSGAAYHLATDGKWIEAQSTKLKRDKDMAERIACIASIKGYEDALKALGCT